MQSVYKRQRTKLYDNWPHGGAIIQCFPNPVPVEAHQQCTFWMSPLSDPSISGLGA